MKVGTGSAGLMSITGVPSIASIPLTHFDTLQSDSTRAFMAVRMIGHEGDLLSRASRLREIGVPASTHGETLAGSMPPRPRTLRPGNQSSLIPWRG